MDSLKILIIDDNPAMLTALVSHILNTPGGLNGRSISVTTTDNTSSAMLYMTLLKFDCVICDWVLPYSDPTIFLPKMRSLAPKAAIIVISAYESSQPDFNSMLVHLGADGFVGKQAIVKELIPLIIRLIP